MKNQEASDNLKDTEFEGATLVEKIEKPSEPDKEPENPGSTGDGNKGKDSPKKNGAVKTGDEAPVLPFAALAGVSLLAIALVLKKKNRAV